MYNRGFLGHKGTVLFTKEFQRRRTPQVFLTNTSKLVKLFFDHTPMTHLCHLEQI